MLIASCGGVLDKLNNTKVAKFGYVVAGTIYSYDIDPVSGIPALIGKAADISRTDMYSLAVSKSSKFLYMGTSNSGLLYAFNINEETSMLKSVGPPADVSFPVNERYTATFSVNSIAPDPQGQFVYINVIVYLRPIDPGMLIRLSVMETFSIERETGVLTRLYVGGPALDNGFQLVFSESGEYAYLATQLEPPCKKPIGVLYILKPDRRTGLLNVIGDVNFTAWTVGDPHPIALDPGGKFLYLTKASSLECVLIENCWSCTQTGSSIESYIIDQSTGLLSHSGASMNVAPEIITWGEAHPSGKIVNFLNSYDYFKGEHSHTYLRVPGSIYSYYLDRNSGELFSSGTAESGLGGSMSIDPTGKFLYLLNSNDIYVYNIDQATGALEVIGTPLSGASEITLPGTSTSRPFVLVNY